MKLRKIIIASIAIAILILGFLSMRGLMSFKNLPQRHKPPKAKRFVSVREVRYGTVDNIITEHGRIQASDQIELVTEGQGRVQKGDIALKVGANFKKGQILYKIDDTQTRLSLKASKSAFMTKLASVLAELKIDNPGRYEIWYRYAQSIDYGKTLPDIPEFENDKEKMFFASRGITADYYNILVSEDRLSKYKYYAPFDGSFANVYTTVGANAKIGTRIGKIVSTDYYELQLPISEKDIKWLKIGMKASIISENADTFSGKILRIGEVIDPNTQSISITIGMPGRKNIYDGQYMKAEILAKEIENAMLLPRKAIFDGNLAWAVEDGKIQEIELDIIRTTEMNAIIRGPNPGTKIVDEPITNAVSGMEVNIIGQDNPKMSPKADKPSNQSEMKSVGGKGAGSSK
ncbi:MAG: efflux RND transporter periplasmic adaptor subunit [Candidatus Zixiibacteriota bacterium]